MTKNPKAFSKKSAVSDAGVVLRDLKTGRSIKVKGVGALKDSGFETSRGVDLLKPVAEQVLRRGARRGIAK